MKSLFNKVKDGLRRGAVAGSAVLILGGVSGCAQIEGQTTTSSVDGPKETTTKNNPELEGVAPERLEFTKDLLNLYDKSITEVVTKKGFETAFNKIKDFINRDQIIEYGKTGETGENLSMVKYKDGSPAVALVNCNDKVASAFEGMVKEISQYDSNFLKKLTENGMVAFMINRFDNNRGDTFTFNKSGLVVYNARPEMVDLINYKVLERAIPTEVFGIKCFNLGGDYGKYSGFIKQQLASDCLEKLYEKSGKDYFKVFAIDIYFIGKDYYGGIYSPVKLEDEEIQKLIKGARDLMEPIGADSWSEIKASTFTE